MNVEDQHDTEFSAHQWAVDNRLPGASEARGAFIDRLAVENEDLNSRLPDLPPVGMTVVLPDRAEVQAAYDAEPVIRVDYRDRYVSGGRLDHNKPPGEAPL